MRSCDDFCDLLDFQSSALWLFTVKNGFGQKSHILIGIYHDEKIKAQVRYGCGSSFKIGSGLGSKRFLGFGFRFSGDFGVL